jgi:hypothetical protein
MIMLFNQLLDMPTPVTWMDYLGNGEMVTNMDLNPFVRKI